MPDLIRYENFYIRYHVGKQCADLVLMKLRDVTTTPHEPQHALPHALSDVQRVIGHVSAVLCRGDDLSLVWRRLRRFIRIKFSPALTPYILHARLLVSKHALWKWSHIFSYHGGPKGPGPPGPRHPWCIVVLLLQGTRTEPEDVFFSCTLILWTVLVLVSFSAM